MSQPPSELQQAEDLVRTVLPAFDMPASSEFRMRVLARAEALQASRHRRWSWGVWPWVQAAIPAVAVGVLLIVTAPWWVAGPFSPRRPSQPDWEFTRRPRGGAQGEGAAPTLYGLVRQARQYEHEGDTAQAIASYQAALDQVAVPLNNLAWLYYQQGDAGTGLPLARLAVQLRPEEAPYLDTLAVLLCTVGEQGEALHTMAKAASLRPEQFREKLARFQQGVCQ